MPLLMPTEADDDGGHGHALPQRWQPRSSHLTRRTLLQASLAITPLPWLGSAAAQAAPAAVAATGVKPEDVMATLEKLGELKTKGILTQEEFDSKKAELLKKLV